MTQAKDVGAPPERSIITVLAVDIVGSTRHIASSDPDDAQTFYDFWFEHVREAVERAGGLIVSYEGDGGIAVFGWPSPLEDHADRACIAAWDIQHPNRTILGPGGQPVQLRVGVHSGLVGLRQVLRDGRSRFDTVGATVNIAAKLQQGARKGEVLISAQTAKLCRSPLKLSAHKRPSSLRELRSDVFKLKSRPENISDSDVARRYRLPIIGRRHELAALRKSLPRPGGKSRSVALIGEAGIGKSRLVAAAVTGALAPNVRVLVFYGDPQKRTTPFAVARALIADLLHLPSAVTDERIRSAMSGIDLDEGDIGPVAAVLTSQPARRRDGIGNLTETQIARSLMNAFSTLALDQPTVLLIEDLHLIDPESRQFLRLLARAKTPQPICLLLTGRPEALHDAHETAQTIIRLDPLPRRDMETLGRQLWPVGRPPAAAIDRAVDRAEGVPFVLEELIRSVEAEDVPAFQPLPHSVESVIHARLHRLSPSAKAVAQTLSILGEEVEIEFARTVLGSEAGALLNDLSELERFAFVHPVSGHSTRFRHQIIAEACADTLPRERRRELHRAAIGAITSRFADLGGRYEQLAFHAEGAGLDEAALDYLWEAGLEARRNSAAGSLNLIFNRAIKLIARVGPTAEDKYVDFVLMASALMVQLGEFEKMNTHLPRVIETARRWGRPRLVSNSLSQLGMISWFEGRYEEALKATTEGLALARELEAPSLIFSNQIMLANALHGLGRLKEAIAEGRNICEMLTGDLETARLGATGIPKAIALAFLCWFMMDTGDYDEGQACARQALEIAERDKDPYSEVLARSVLGRSLLMLGRDDEAGTCMRAALRLSEQNGYDAIKPDLVGRTAMALARTGHSREAIELVEDCLARGLHLRTGQLEVYYLYAGYAEALVRQGRVEQGLDRLADALAIAKRTGNPCWMAEGLQLRAHLLDSVAPKDPRIKADLAERDTLCERYGLASWRPKKSGAV